ncbi:MAG TPA: DNA repair protein RecN [Thermoleophilaceae bacterium]|nr:DNA repair protein RecN [Thermoleophilaceae bacterium]
MLVELRVENLLLIERAELRLGSGLNALTGETGAGKTVLAHALDLLLGGKPRAGIVRPGASEAYVEGVFEAPPSLLEDPDLGELRERLPDDVDEIVLGRRVGADGRTRAFVQGRSASAADLRELGARLISFYGQHEHRKLTIASAQLDLLDGFGGERAAAARSELAACHADVLGAVAEVDELRGRAGARDRDIDLLAFEIEEIEALGPSEDEHAELLADRQRLRHVDALRAASGGAAEALAPEAGENGATALLAQAEGLAEGPGDADPALVALADRLRALRIEADDVAAELRRYEAGLEAEPGRLQEVEERLEGYERLVRKHGGSVAAVLAHAERCRTERDRLAGAEVALEQAEARLGALLTARGKLAKKLSGIRAKAAPALAERVEQELAELAMDGASFAVELQPREQVAATGAERVEFMIAPNPGVPAAPLRDSASGGELSRVMLALMSVAAGGGPATLVFDEVDAGIGGHTARAVGEKLRTLGRGRQVLCITHLPQIAALADRHFRIEKASAEELARTTVSELRDKEIVEELCRMLGADAADPGARKHAQALLA